MTENETKSQNFKAVFNLEMLRFLLNKGLYLEKVKPNYYHCGKVVFLFSDTAEFRQAISDYSDMRRSRKRNDTRKTNDN